MTEKTGTTEKPKSFWGSEILETKHLLILGKTGTGKSTLIDQQMKMVRELGYRAVVFDYKGDFISKHYNEKRGDIIVNPLDKRTVQWNIFNEIETEMDIIAIATSLIPPSFSSTQAFWLDGTREVFAAILRSCAMDGTKNNKAVWEKLSMPTSELYNYLKEHKQSAALQYIPIAEQAAGQAAGIMSTLMRFTGIFEKLQYIDGDFSFKKWAQDENEKGWIFILNSREVSELLKPFMSLVVDHLTRVITLLPKDLNRRIFVFIDEFARLQKLPSIVSFLVTARDRGGVMIAAGQDIGAIQEVYGRDIIDTFTTLQIR